MLVRHVLPAGTPFLEELVLAEQSWLTLAAAILHALGKAFGPQAGILLDDPSWGVARKGLRGAKTRFAEMQAASSNSGEWAFHPGANVPADEANSTLVVAKPISNAAPSHTVASK